MDIYGHRNIPVVAWSGFKGEAIEAFLSMVVGMSLVEGGKEDVLETKIGVGHSDTLINNHIKELAYQGKPMD